MLKKSLLYYSDDYGKHGVEASLRELSENGLFEGMRPFQIAELKEEPYIAQIMAKKLVAVKKLISHGVTLCDLYVLPRRKLFDYLCYYEVIINVLSSVNVGEADATLPDNKDSSVMMFYKLNALMPDDGSPRLFQLLAAGFAFTELEKSCETHFQYVTQHYLLLKNLILDNTHFSLSRFINDYEVDQWAVVFDMLKWGFTLPMLDEIRDLLEYSDVHSTCVFNTLNDSFRASHSEFVMEIINTGGIPDLFMKIVHTYVEKKKRAKILVLLTKLEPNELCWFSTLYSTCKDKFSYWDMMSFVDFMTHGVHPKELLQLNADQIKVVERFKDVINLTHLSRYGVAFNSIVKVLSSNEDPLADFTGALCNERNKHKFFPLISSSGRSVHDQMVWLYNHLKKTSTISERRISLFACTGKATWESIMSILQVQEYHIKLSLKLKFSDFKMYIKIMWSNRPTPDLSLSAPSIANPRHYS